MYNVSIRERVTKGNNFVPAAISKVVGTIVSPPSVSRTKRIPLVWRGRGVSPAIRFARKPACSIPSGLKMIPDNWKQPDTWRDKSRDIVRVVALKSCKGKLEDTAA